MEFWNTIINTALIGTDKKQVNANELPAALGEPVALIHENPAKDKEEKFLQTAALLLNYRLCGSKPVHREISIATAEAEAKPYCNETGQEVLKDIVLEDNFHLLN